MGVLSNCKPRAEVLKGDLADALFAASLGNVLNAKAANVYQDASTFFENTHPAEQLKKIAQAVFQRIADPSEPGAVVRLSTGFGGGKSHALIALWHLARSINDFNQGTDLLPAAQRPKEVRVAAVDGEAAGVPDFATHEDARTHSLAGEIAYQLGGAQALKALGAADNPNASPNMAQIEAMLPEEPVLILMDEVVTYMAKLDAQGRGNLKGFISALANAVTARKQAVLVITDPAAQQAYARETSEVNDALRSSVELDQILGRRFSEFDPIKDEGAQVISRRLFERIDSGAAQAISATYKALYERVLKDPETSHLLPKSVLDPDFLQRFVVCYPFHPRLIETAQNRLAILPDYQRGRGTLRLFARLIRDVWERGEDIDLIDAGDVDWSSDRIQADLLQRLNRDQFKAVVDADVRQHAGELDGAPMDEEGAARASRLERGHHTRVASALLLESLPMDSNAAMSVADVTLATLRPQDAGHEPAEALDRLLAVCWYTYPTESGERFRFRIEPNVNRQIDEKMQSIKDKDVSSKIRSRVQTFYSGTAFQTANWPDDVAAVPKTGKPVLVLTDRLDLAKEIVQYEGTTDDGHRIPRIFVNNLVAIAPEPGLYQSAVERAKRLEAAEMLEKEAKKGNGDQLALKQLAQILPGLGRNFRIEAVRAFNRLVLHTGQSKNGNGYSVHSITEEVLASDDACVANTGGQVKLKEFLEKKDLMYRHDDTMDRSMFVERVMRGTPEHEGRSSVYTAAALYERMLSVPGLKLLGDGGVFRETIKKGVQEGLFVVRNANGHAFDKDGCVIGRKRVSMPLATVAPDASTLITLADSDAAKEWLEVEEPDETNGPSPPPPPPPTEPDTLDAWEDIIAAAAERALVRLTLTANSPADAATLSIAAVELSPAKQELGLELTGPLKESGFANLRMEGVQPNHPLRELAPKVYNALDPARASVSFQLTMSFEEEGRAGMQHSLERAREALREKQTEDRIRVKARFRSAQGIS